MVTIGVLAATLIAVSGLIVYLQFGNSIPTSTDTASDISSVPSSVPSSEPPPPSSEPEPEPVSVTLLGVGDNLIHSGIYDQARRRGGGTVYDFAEAYKEVAPIISAADIASLNQETVLASIFEPATYPMFNSPTELGDEMLKIGFDVFNQATNHTIDKGEKGILSTLEYWSTKPDATVVGVYKDAADAERIRTLTRDGITFSFLGMTELTNGLSLPEGSDVVLMRTQDTELVKQRIAAAKAISDVVVVNVHWGVEYTHTPNENQKALAKTMVDAGADIIFGHHPHVIQPVEYIVRADGSRAVVVYSLGNFISAQDRAPRMLGGMLEVTVTKDKEDTTLTDVRFLPVITHYDANFANIRNYPFSSYTPELAEKHGVRAKSPEFNYDYLKTTIETVIDSQFLK